MRPIGYSAKPRKCKQQHILSASAILAPRALPFRSFIPSFRQVRNTLSRSSPFLPLPTLLFLLGMVVLIWAYVPRPPLHKEGPSCSIHSMSRTLTALR